MLLGYLKILVLANTIYFLHSAYVIDSINDSENHKYAINLVQGKELIYQDMYNEEFQMNMSEQYIKGVTIFSPFESNLTIGWNTSFYIGEFQSNINYVVEITEPRISFGLIPILQKCELKFSIILIDPISSELPKIDDIIISMGTFMSQATIKYLNGSKVQTLYKRKKIFSHEIKFLGDIIKSSREKNRIAREYAIQIVFFSEEQSTFYLKLIPDFSKLSQKWSINNIVVENFENCPVNCYDIQDFLNNSDTGLSFTKYSCLSNYKDVEDIEQVKTECLLCSSDLQNNEQNLASCNCLQDQEPILFYKLTFSFILTTLLDSYDKIDKKCEQKEILPQKFYPSKFTQAFWYHLQKNITYRNIYNDYSSNNTLSGVNLQSNYIFKGKVSDLPENFYQKQNGPTCLFINYTTSKIDLYGKRITEEMVMSCTFIDKLTIQQKKIFLDKIYIKNRKIYKNLNKNLLKWERYMKELEINIPFDQDFNPLTLPIQAFSIFVKVYQFTPQKQIFSENLIDHIPLMMNPKNSYFKEYMINKTSIDMISMNLEGYFLQELRLNFYLCKDSTCQKKNEFAGFEILSLNYMQVIITDPDLEGNIIVEEMTYTLSSESYSTERFLIPQIQKFHPYKQQELIIGFLINSLVEDDSIRFRLKASYQPSVNEYNSKRHMFKQIEIPAQTDSYRLIMNEIEVVDEQNNIY